MTELDDRSDARFASIARLAFWTTVALFAALAAWLLARRMGADMYDPQALSA
jgi:hypothetical protein